MRANLLYLGTCLPDYFQGFAGPVLCVALSSRPRTGEVYRSLVGEIRMREFCPTDFLTDHDMTGAIDSGRIYKQLYRSAKELFSERDKRTSWSTADDLSESYAYFGVKLEEGK